MAHKPPLRAADDLLAPAVERTIEAIDAPEQDAAVVALARVLARAVDRMPDGQRAVMLGQTAPQLLKVLNELEERARRRRTIQPGAPNRLQQLRAARAAGDIRRQAGR